MIVLICPFLFAVVIIDNRKGKSLEELIQPKCLNFLLLELVEQFDPIEVLSALYFLYKLDDLLFLV